MSRRHKRRSPQDAPPPSPLQGNQGLSPPAPPAQSLHAGNLGGGRAHLFSGEHTRGKKRKKKPLDPAFDANGSRDLSSLLSAGPAYIPFTNAWTDYRHEQVKSYKHWIYVAIHKIASTVATSPPNISWIRSEGDGGPHYDKTSILPSHFRHKALSPLQAHEDIEPTPADHPLNELVRDPNDPDTGHDLWYETILFLLLTGSAYWWMPRNEVGLPVAIWVIPSHWVWPIYGRKKNQLVESYDLRPVEGNYLHKVLPAEEVLHIKMKNPISKIDGYSPLSAGSQWADVSDMRNKALWSVYRQGTFPTVAVQFDGRVYDPSDDDLRRIEAKFIARYTGETRANKPLFLPPGVKVVPLNIKPNEMIFGEVGDACRDAVLALFGVPALIAGINTGMTYGSILAAQAGFMQFTVNPLLKFLGQVITEKLAWLYERTLRIWWEDRTPQDPELLLKQIQTALLGGAITPNEMRSLILHMAPLPDAYADKPILPVNMQPGALSGGGSHKPSTEGTPSSHPTNGEADKKSILSLLASMNTNGVTPHPPFSDNGWSERF